MRYSSALVLGTLAAGSAAAAHNGRHASFHARRNAETKRGVQDTDWSKVSYDLSGVNWSTVKFGSPQATPTPSAQGGVAQVQAVSSVAYQQPETSATPTPTSANAASSSKAAAPSQSSSSSSGAAGDFTKGVSAFFAGLNLAVKIDSSYTNQKSGNIYIGDGSAWKANFINGGGEDLYFACWEKTKGGDFGGMSLNANAPAVAAYLAPGDSLTVSFAEKVPAACAPLVSGTTLSQFGGVFNTWWEATFTSAGAFDVSRNVNMNGTPIHSKGSKCTSDMNTCVFKCQDDKLPSCKTGYDLYNCGSTSGGGGGYDANMGGTGGGCAMGASGETVTVTFNSS